MPRSKKSPVWLKHLQAATSREELSRGVTFREARRDPATGKVGVAPVRVRGAGIPVRRLWQLEQGLYSPTKKEISKLRNFYSRLAYRQLRVSGVPAREARLRRMASLRDVKDLSGAYLRGAEKIAEIRGVATEIILESLKKSSVSPADLQRRIVRSGLRDWRQAMSEDEFEDLVDSELESGEYDLFSRDDDD